MSLNPVPDPKVGYPWSRYFSALGGPGLAAFCGLEAFGDAKKVRLHLSVPYLIFNVSVGRDDVRILWCIRGREVCSPVRSFSIRLRSLSLSKVFSFNWRK
jgi:hypothetical protein